LSVIGWGVGLGGKLFDLLVVAGAWSAAPPASFAALAYGPRFPLNPGDFFQPLSAVMLLGMLGAMISEWKTRFDYRVWLLLPIASFLGLWAFTPTIFWPMINEYYGGATGKNGFISRTVGLSSTGAAWLESPWVSCHPFVRSASVSKAKLS